MALASSAIGAVSARGQNEWLAKEGGPKSAMGFGLSQVPGRRFGWRSGWAHLTPSPGQWLAKGIADDLPRALGVKLEVYPSDA